MFITPCVFLESQQFILFYAVLKKILAILFKAGAHPLFKANKTTQS